MKRMALLMTLVAAVLLPMPLAYAVPLPFVTTLNGATESPPTPSPGTGQATVTLDPAANTMLVQVTFSGLLAPTTASHIHCCVSPSATPPNAGIATTVPTFPGFPLGVTAGSYTQLFDMTSAASYNPAFVTANGGTIAGAESALFAGIEAGDAYLNIHSVEFPSGEIRGFLVPAPEPATLLLLGTGLAGLGGFTWRRRRRG